MALRLKTAPSTEPVTLAEAKSYCRVTIADDDGDIAALITAAREKVETDSGLCLMLQTWQEILAEFPWNDGRIRLEKAPYKASLAITYYDDNNALQTLSAASYQVSLAGIVPAFAELTFGSTWPGTYPRQDAVTVEYQSGYADAASVPGVAKLAIKLLLRHWYDNRGIIASGQVAPLPIAYENLIAAFGVKSI